MLDLCDLFDKYNISYYCFLKNEDSWGYGNKNQTQEENTKFYIQEYYKKVLSQVDIEELLKDEKDPILLCYERGQDFCHRHVLAEFINIRYGIDVEDFIIDENLNISINKRPENVRKILEEVLIEQLPYINDEVLKKKVESMIENVIYLINIIYLIIAF